MDDERMDAARTKKISTFWLETNVVGAQLHYCMTPQFMYGFNNPNYDPEKDMGRTVRSDGSLGNSKGMDLTLDAYIEHSCDGSTLGCSIVICHFLYLCTPVDAQAEEFKLCIIAIWQAAIAGEYDFVLEVEDE